MAYDNPVTVTYSLGSHTTTSALNTTVRGPKGLRGRVRDIIFNCTTTHVLGTTPTKYQIGEGATAEAFATFAPAAATAPTTLTASAAGAAVGANAVAEIPANTLVTVKSVANATGSPAGVARVDLVIDWY
jgi:hypothetical protein